jgi:protein required for attachment to host cells
MGTGEVAEFASRQAKQVLIRNGYKELLDIELDRKLMDLRKSLTNVLGESNMEKIDKALVIGRESIKEAARRLENENP